MKYILLISLSFFVLQLSFGQSRSRSKKAKPLTFIETGVFYQNGLSVNDRFGGEYFKPYMISPLSLSIGRLKFIRQKTIKTKRKRERKELRKPELRSVSLSANYGRATNNIDEGDPLYNWKGFHDRRLIVQLKYGLGKKLNSTLNNGLSWLINTTLFYEDYRTQDFNYPNQFPVTYNYLGLGLSPEIFFMTDFIKNYPIKIGVEVGPIAVQLSKRNSNNPYQLEYLRQSIKLGSRLKHSMVIFKVGVFFNK